jgi:hypothetical protein
VDLAAEQYLVAQEVIGAPIVQQAQVTHQMRRAVLQRECPWPIAWAEQLGAQAAEPRRRGRLAQWKSTDLNDLSHDRPICLQRPKLTYVSVMNLLSTFRPFKPILKGRS